MCVCGLGSGVLEIEAWVKGVSKKGVGCGLFLEEVLNLPLSRGSGWRKCYTKIYDEKSIMLFSS